MHSLRLFSPIAVALLILPGSPARSHAQQPTPMPGMDMSSPSPAPRPTQASPHQHTPASGTGSIQPLQVPKDLRGPGLGSSPSAARAHDSMVDSVAQQRPQSEVHPGSGSDASSFSYDSLRTQELENLNGHTGAESLPAPELLRALADRTPMSLEDFLALAQHGNPTLAQMHSVVEQTTQQAHQVALPPNPTIGYSAEHIRGGEYGGGEQGAYISQQFVLGGKLGLRREIYRTQTAANSFGVEEQTARVRSDVSQQFYRTLVAQAAVVLQQRLLKVALDGAETAHQLANVGQADAPDVLTAELEAERAKVEFTNAQREFLGAFSMLAAAAGARSLPPTALSGSVEDAPILDAEAQVAQMLAESPAVKRSQAEVRVAEARLKDARRESVPDLTVRAGEWYSGERIESANKPAGPMSFVDAGVNLPLWNRNQGNVGAAKAQLERARNEVSRTELALKRDAEPMAQHYLAARFEAERYRTELLPRARRAYELYVMKYQQMAQPYMPVLASQRMLFELQMEYLRALESLWTNAIALQNYALANGLEVSMNASSGSDSTTINLPSGSSQ